jgi:hypothetical protein
MPGFENLRIVPAQRKWDKLRPKAKIAHLGPSHDANNSWMVGKQEVIRLFPVYPSHAAILTSIDFSAFPVQSQLRDAPQAGHETQGLLVAVVIESNFEERFWSFSS